MSRCFFFFRSSIFAISKNRFRWYTKELTSFNIYCLAWKASESILYLNYSRSPFFHFFVCFHFICKMDLFMLIALWQSSQIESEIFTKLFTEWKRTKNKINRNRCSLGIIHCFAVVEFRFWRKLTEKINWNQKIVCRLPSNGNRYIL